MRAKFARFLARELSGLRWCDDHVRVRNFELALANVYAMLSSKYRPAYSKAYSVRFDQEVPSR